MKKQFLKLLLLIFMSVVLVSCVYNKPNTKPPVITPPIEELPEEETPIIPPEEEVPPVEEEKPEKPLNFGYEDEIYLGHYDDVKEDGLYITRNEVAIYIFYYNKLPVNFITKSQAGGKNGQNIKNLWTKENMKSVGGDRFGNYEGLLPKNPKGGSYTELDIGYVGVARGMRRIVYASKTEIYYTSDHYKSFIWLDTEAMIWTSY